MGLGFDKSREGLKALLKHQICRITTSNGKLGKLLCESWFIFTLLHNRIDQFLLFFLMYVIC